jgi:hypothetical protein
MTTVFVFSMAIGGIVLVGQILLSFIGLADGSPDLVDDMDGASGALNLLSVRALSAGAVIFGAAGLMLLPALPGLLAWMAAPLAVVPAFGATAATAYLTRLMYRAQSQGNLQLDGAVGQLGTVYLRIPAANGGTGIVQFTLQGRTIELPASTREGDELATGSSVLVISVDAETGTAEVISSTSIIEELES